MPPGVGGSVRYGRPISVEVVPIMGLSFGRRVHVLYSTRGYSVLGGW